MHRQCCRQSGTGVAASLSAVLSRWLGLAAGESESPRARAQGKREDETNVAYTCTAETDCRRVYLILRAASKQTPLRTSYYMCCRIRSKPRSQSRNTSMQSKATSLTPKSKVKNKDVPSLSHHQVINTIARYNASATDDLMRSCNCQSSNTFMPIALATDAIPSSRRRHCG